MATLRRRTRLPLRHPAAWLATWFGAGLAPIAPGTWGSAAALPFAALIDWLAGPRYAQPVLVLAALAVYLVGIWASGYYARALGIGDPGAVVIDEVAGQWLTLSFVPLDPALFAIGFFLFRGFDIVKPWPANWAERRLPGGLGIMTDDLVAGFYAGGILWGVHRWLI